MPAFGATRFWMNDPAPVEALRFRRVPLLTAALAFAAGELLAPGTQLPGILLSALACLTLLTVASLWKAPRAGVAPVLGLWVALGCLCAQIQPAAAAGNPTLAGYADGLSRTVRGRVMAVRMLPPRTATAATPGKGTPGESVAGESVAGESLPAAPWQLEPGAAEAEGTTPTESVDLALTEAEDVTPDTATLRPVDGGLRVTLLDGTLPLACGDLVEMPLRFHEPELYRDAGAPSYAGQLAREGVSVLGNVRAARVRQLSGPSTSHQTRRGALHCRLQAAQRWASARLLGFVRSRANLHLPAIARLTPDDAAMLSAMLFGDRTALTHELRAGFERTGTFHLFVVSGMHIGLLAAGLFVLLRKARAPLGLATVLTLAGTAAYAALTGFGVPAQRALLMTAIFLAARWLWRGVDVLQAIGAAALAVLVADPGAIREASFQMTFLALMAVGGLALPLVARWLEPRIRATRHLRQKHLDAQMPPPLAQLRVVLRLFGEALAGVGPVAGWRRPRRWMEVLPALLLRLLLRTAELALVGLVIECCMAVPMAVYFHRATPLALPTNILAVPLVAVLAPLALMTFGAALVSPWLAMLPGAFTAMALHGVRALVALLGNARLADLRVPPPAAPALIGIAVAIAFSVWAVRRCNRWALAAGIAAIACIPLAALWPTAPRLHPGVLEVTALDVGQGDSLFVASPDGRTMLVDAGGPVGGTFGYAERVHNSASWDVGEEVVAPYLWSRGLRRLDVVLLTHAHSDHMGGMPAILRDFRPRELWVSLDPAGSPEYRALLAEAIALGIRIRHWRAGDATWFGAVRCNVLAPEPGYAGADAPVNDDSLVVELDWRDASALLEGDAERPSEQAMLASGRLTPVTLLKVGHHGSRTSTSPEFLAAVQPRAAVVSDGRRNTFGHPRPEVLARLEAAHTFTVRTDRAGATTFLLAPDGSYSTLEASR